MVLIYYDYQNDYHFSFACCSESNLSSELGIDCYKENTLIVSIESLAAKMRVYFEECQEACSWDIGILCMVLGQML